MTTPQIDQNLNFKGEYSQPRCFEMQVWARFAPSSTVGHKLDGDFQDEGCNAEHGDSEGDDEPLLDYMICVVGHQWAFSRQQACQWVVYKLGFDALDRLLACFILDPDQSIIDLVAQENPDMWSQPSDEEALAAMVMERDRLKGEWLS